MAHLVNPISYRLSYNCYWNNSWALGSYFNYSYICMLDYCLYKYLSFMWDKLRWYRKAVVFFDFKFFRVFNTLFLNLFYKNHKIAFKLKILSEDPSFLKKNRKNFKKKVIGKFKKHLKKNVNLKKRNKKLKKNLRLSLKLIKRRRLISLRMKRKRLMRLNLKSQIKIDYKKVTVVGSTLYMKKKVRVSVSNNKKVKKTHGHAKTKLCGLKHKVEKKFLNFAKKRMKLKKIHRILCSYIVLNLYNSFMFKMWKLYLLNYIKKFTVGITPIVNIIFISLSSFSAFFFAKYIRTKLAQRFPFKWVFKFMFKRAYFALKYKKIYGFKILVSGRFSRRDRAVYFWDVKGKIPLNSTTKNIDYCMLGVNLKNSRSGIKVWLHSQEGMLKLFVF